MSGSQVALPPFYDDLDATLAEAWRLLVSGAGDRRTGFHTPVLASVRGDGRPAARTVVLRSVDPDLRSLRFHTDRRSMKFEELAAEPRVSMHFYDPTAKAQLRVDGLASRHAADELADLAWRQTRPMSRVCYRVSPAPGLPIENPTEAVTEGAGENADGRENFAAITVAVETIEWLYLAARGHRRARFRWQDGALDATWLVP